MAAESTPMTCEEIDELAAAFALDALPADELTRVEAHLATCANSHAAMRDLGETASLLALLSPVAEPPAHLGPRIATLARADESNQRDEASADIEPMLPSVTPLRPRHSLSRSFLAGIAAAFALLASGLGLWGLAQHRALENRVAESAGDRGLLATLAAGSTLVQTERAGSLSPALIVQPSDGGDAYLLVDWPSAGPGKAYQAWLIMPGQRPLSAGVFNGSGGYQAVRLTHPITGSQALAVTLEPAAGSEQPTSQPFLVRTLPS